MQYKNKLIAIEGILGVGKTTISKILARELDGVYYNITKKFHEMRLIAENNLSVEARFHFYLSLNLQASFEMNELLKSKNVICDKYIWTTICYYKTFGVNIIEPLNINILQPDFHFLLFCDEQKRLARISKRDPINDLSKDVERQNQERKCLIEFEKRLQNSVINNSSDDPQIAINEILKKME